MSDAPLFSHHNLTKDSDRFMTWQQHLIAFLEEIKANLVNVTALEDILRAV